MVREPTGSVWSSGPPWCTLSAYLFDFDVVTVLTKLSGAGRVLFLTCQLMWYMWKNRNRVVSPVSASKYILPHYRIYLWWCIELNYTRSVAFVTCTDHHPMTACLSFGKHSTASIAWSQCTSPVHGLAVWLTAVAFNCSRPMTSWRWHDAAAAMTVKSVVM